MLAVDIAITRNDTAALSALKGSEVQEVIRRGMNMGGELLVGKIREKRFTGRSANSLGVVTGMGRRSVHAAPAVVTGGAVEMEIGSNVGYIKAHEYGFKGTVDVKQHIRRGYVQQRVVARNNFTGKATKVEKKDIAAQTVRAHKRKVNIKERSMIRGGAEDDKQVIVDGIRDAIRDEMNQARA